jgi:hypothetical protein
MNFAFASMVALKAFCTEKNEPRSQKRFSLGNQTGGRTNTHSADNLMNMSCWLKAGSDQRVQPIVYELRALESNQPIGEGDEGQS